MQYDRSSLRNPAFKLLLIYLEQKEPRPNLSKIFLKTSFFLPVLYRKVSHTAAFVSHTHINPDFEKNRAVPQYVRLYGIFETITVYLKLLEKIYPRGDGK